MTLNPDTELMKIADEFADFDLLKPKDRPSPQFKTQETNSMFILTTKLKGYECSNIKVESNNNASIISVSGETPFKDMLMVGGKVVREDIKMRGFQKSFKVPKGVILDKINARFNAADSELIIRMPKATKCLTGVEIKELKTGVQAERTELVQVYTDGELSEQEIEETEDENVESRIENKSNESYKDEISRRSKGDDSDESKSTQKKFKICSGVMFGSAFFVSLIVLVYHLVQSEKPVKQQKKRDQD